MATMDESQRAEYGALMNRLLQLDRLGHWGWMAALLVAAGLLAWGLVSRQPGLMIPVVLVAAGGFVAASRAQEETRLVAGYVEGFLEEAGESPAYFTRLSRLEATRGSAPGREWRVTALLNAVSVAGAACSWISAARAPHGELLAGIATGCALALASYSVSETARPLQIDHAALWRQLEKAPRELKRCAGGAER